MVTVSQRRVSASFHSGPLPAPTAFAEYEGTLPGAADRILTMVEDQARHRQGLEVTKVAGDLGLSERGQWFGLVITLAALGFGTYLISIDKDIWGLTLMLGELGTIVYLYLSGKHAQAKVLADHRRELDKASGRKAPESGG